MNFQQHLEDIKINLKKSRFELEYLELVSIEEKTEKDKERINKLEIIIDSLIPKLKEQKKDIFFKQIDNLTYKKPWNRLQSFHRMVKIEEYLEKNYKNENFYEDLKKQFTELIQANKLTTKKFVSYDSTNETITSIPCLIIKDGKFEIKQ